jgi:glycerate 2-kinase
MMSDARLTRMRDDAQAIFWAGIEAVKGDNAVRRHCKVEKDRFVVDGQAYSLSGPGDVFVIGAGKAGACMAKAIEDLLGARVSRGIINVKYGHLASLDRIELVEAGHPVPDEAGQRGAQAIFDLASGAREGDLVICVISGGGSALLPLPVEGVTLADKQVTTRVLLACGAGIREINAVRKHISAVKGGGLARAAHPATLLTVILSDVIGDDLDVIASGPTVPDSSSFASCMKTFEKYGIQDKIPRSVLAYIERGVSGEVEENPKPGDPIFARTHNVIVGSNRECVQAAEETARTVGYGTLVLSTMLEGEAREVAHVYSAIAKEVLKSGRPLSAPACVLSGGETTVTLRGAGLGGRNQELALATAMGIAELGNVVFLSGGTDGTDGPTDAAGAIADGRTLQRAQRLGIDPWDHLADNDAYHFFEKVGDLVKTGPTDTNVMDLQILLVR